MSMELESEEDTNRWGKLSPPYNNPSQSSSSSPDAPKKKKKKRHHSSNKKKRKKRKRSKSKKKKSHTKKQDNRWRPQPDTNDNNAPQTKSFKINKQKIKISFTNPLQTSVHNTSSTNTSITSTTSSSKSRSKSPPKPTPKPTKKSHQNRSHSRSPSNSRSRSRSRSSSNSLQQRRYSHQSHGKGRYSRDRDRDRERDRNRYNKYDHFTYAPPRCYRDAMQRQRNPRIREKKRINHKVIAALNEIQEKHKDDNVHPLDLKQQELRTVASLKDKAMIWAAASGHFETEILKSSHFQKNISLALNALNVGNKEFDIAVLFKQFSNYSVKLIWKDCSRSTSVNRSELLTFRDLMSIRSYRKELNHCNALWKFIFYDQRHLFWSMAIYYALLKTTLVPEWDAMFEKQYDLIRKYGKNDYIEKDVEGIEERKQDKKVKRDKKRKRKHDDMSDHDMDNDSV